MLLKIKLVYRINGRLIIFDRTHINHPYKIPGILGSGYGCNYNKKCKYYQDIGQCKLRDFKILVENLKCGFDIYKPYNFLYYENYINYKYIL